MAAKKTVATVEKSFTDELADEATPAQKPVGSPSMRPFGTLKRAERVGLFKLIAPVIDFVGEDGAVDVETMSLKDQFSAGLETLLAAQAACVHVAIDAEQMDDWCESVSDNTVVALVTWYRDRF